MSLDRLDQPIVRCSRCRSTRCNYERWPDLRTQRLFRLDAATFEGISPFAHHWVGKICWDTGAPHPAVIVSGGPNARARPEWVVDPASACHELSPKGSKSYDRRYESRALLIADAYEWFGAHSRPGDLLAFGSHSVELNPSLLLWGPADVVAQGNALYALSENNYRRSGQYVSEDLANVLYRQWERLLAPWR